MAGVCRPLAVAALLCAVACVRVKDEVIHAPAGAAGAMADSGASASGGGAGGAGDATAPADGPSEVAPPLTRNCKAGPDNLNGAPKACAKRAPAMAFEPRLKWSWSEEPDDLNPTFNGSVHVPLVANLTDDNGDGVVDLCDTPDVVINVAGAGNSGRIYVLAGDTGQTEFQMESMVDFQTTPAIGDIDGDGVPEIIALSSHGSGETAHLLIFDNKGRLKITGGEAAGGGEAISIYDLDADGKPEIVVDARDVFDNQGTWLFGNHQANSVTDAAADLDGDGKLELILGLKVFHSDGTLAFNIDGKLDGRSQLGGYRTEPHIANFDDDPEPEILMVSTRGFLMLEANGRVKFGPVSVGPAPLSTYAVGVVHDFDGDGKPDIALPFSDMTYRIFGVSATGVSLRWKAPIPIPETMDFAAGTAFDFLGRGGAQAVFAGPTSMFVWDGRTGTPDFMREASNISYAYPVVADVDADGSADILVISGEPSQPKMHPTLQVFEDAQKRWIPTRRIWNQYNYVVANVRDDGTIPTVMPPYWRQTNTVRANAQIEDQSVCLPVVQ